MKDFVTCGQMKILEKRANAAGLSYYEMMERAGTAAAELIAAKFAAKYGKPLSKVKIILFCGKGNNGGDGFVAARKFMEQGASITIVLVDGAPTADDAVTNFSLIKDQVQIIDMTKTESPFMEIRGRQDILVDAIYGTGFHGKLRPNALKAAAFINQFSDQALICALDSPSGLGGDAIQRQHIDANAVQAHLTVTFHNKKPVHLKSFARKYCGETFIADIGIDEDALW